MNHHSHRGTSATPDELRAQVEVTRHELGHTVQALAAKADVRTRAQLKAGQVRGQLRERATQAGTKARDTAHLRGHPDGRAHRPNGTGMRTRSDAAAQARHEKAAALAQTARDKRVLAAAAAAALTFLVVLAGRHRSSRRGR